jgi:DNA mismatch endonuclease (patch repair protein)
MRIRRSDIMSPEARSRVMGRITGKNTKPELAVRALLRGLGYRYKLHVRRLPGCPDIVLTKERVVIFVHGCFWHRHDCGRDYRPKTRAAFWRAKFRANVERDNRNMTELARERWRVMIVWECQLSKPSLVTLRLKRFLARPR